jgi:hypothetical protein
MEGLLRAEVFHVFTQVDFQFIEQLHRVDSGGYPLLAPIGDDFLEIKHIVPSTIA